MKKKFVFTAIALTLALLLAAALVWWNLPVYFLKEVDADEVVRIEVFSGSSGNRFDITAAEDIDYIVSGVQGAKMKRSKLSTGYKGFSFRLSFYGANNALIDTFIINSETNIRQDPFFYRTQTGTLCYEYLQELENALS